MRHAERAEHSHPALLAEGFNEVVFASSLYRLEPHLRRLSETQNADIGLDGSDGLGDLLLVRRFFPGHPAAVALEAQLGRGGR